jgi:hypothetical protein
MYQLQTKPDASVTTRNGNRITPVATLKDEHGGVFHIIKDDSCYVLVSNRGKFTFHWFPEAVEAVKSLPTPMYA